MTLRRPFSAHIFYALVLSMFFPLFARAGDIFQPPSSEELQMTSEPNAPGAPAIILYRQVDRDDRAGSEHENVYVRTKILTDEGRKYADIEIPFNKGSGNNVVNVRARTVRPDGSIVNYEGKVYEKSIVKAKGLRYMAKTLTLPDVQVGSIIEYSYTTDLSEYFIFDSHWILSDELFTKYAKFTLRPYVSPYGNMICRWHWQELPVGTAAPKEGPDHIVRLEARNIPAFHTEDYMPPEDELKARVDFTYSTERVSDDVDKFWKTYGKKVNGVIDNFIDKRKAMEQAVGQIVSPTDTPEIKLQKIYARVQQIRNTSYEVQKTEQEQKRDKDKEASNVEDVWKHGYGNGRVINWLFLALARAAGFEAYPVLASDRRNYFFSPRGMDTNKLDADVVLVKVNGKDLYLDPGAAFTPFGYLEWSETGVAGLRLDKDGGTWVTTTLPASSESRIERKANLTLTETGDLEGTLTITFTGLEALRRRVEERNEDAADKKKFLEDQAQEYVPVACEVDLTNQPDWASSSPQLVAEYKVRIQGWVAGAGRRAMMPVGIFSATEKRLFDHTDRIHPIYFQFPFEKVDDINISLPLGWKISSLPRAENQDAKLIVYTFNVENNKGTLHLGRKLSVDAMLLDVTSYGTLRSFFQSVRTVDEEQVVLQPIAAGN